MTLHACSQADVVAVPWVSASIAVTNQTIFAKLVFVRSRLPFDDRNCCKTQRQIEHRGFENCLWSNEWDTSGLKFEASGQHRARHRLPMQHQLLFGESKCSESDLSIEGGHR